MSETTDPRDRSAAEIENDVERSRARVNDTIDALRSSLSPGQIIDQVVDYARDSGGSDFVRNLGASVRDNPLPVMLIGTGIGWLLFSGQKPADRYRSGYGSYPKQDDGPGLMERAGDMVSGAKDAVLDAAARAGEAMNDAAGAASDMRDGVVNRASRVGAAVGNATGSGASIARDMGDSVRRQRHDMSDAIDQGREMAADGAARLRATASKGWRRMSREQPLLLGALGLAVGAALGALLPRTRMEDELVGEASDTVTRQVVDTAQEHYAAAKETIAEHVDEAKGAVADAYGDTKDKLDANGLAARTVGDGVKDAAAGVAAAVTSSVSDLAHGLRDGMDKAMPAKPETIDKPGPVI